MTSDPAPSKINIFGYGNPARGDDALGPLLLNLIEREGSRWNIVHQIKLITDYQLQIEHAADLDNCDVAFFIDASVAAPDPYGFTQLKARHDTSYTSHALSPAAVLEVFERINQQSAPPAFLLSIRGECFELGASLSESAQNNLAAACQFTRNLLENHKLPSTPGW